MKRHLLATLSLVVVLALVLPCVALADAPERFAFTPHLEFPMIPQPCSGFSVWSAGDGVVAGYVHYDRDGNAFRSYRLLRWDFTYYSPETGKAVYGSGVYVNFFEGDMNTPLRATLSYRVVAPHYGVVYAGAGQIVFSSPSPEPTTILKEVGMSPFWGGKQQLCEALAP